MKFATATTDCKVADTAITGCAVHRPTTSSFVDFTAMSASQVAANREKPNCEQCSSSTPLIKQHIPTTTTNPTATTCSAYESSGICSSGQITDCAQVMCTSEANTANWSSPSKAVCMRCAAGKQAQSGNSASKYGTCITGTQITNCSIEYIAWAAGFGSGSATCHTAATGYAVGPTATAAAVAYTATTNCRVVDSGPNCITCNDGYHWNAATCVMASNLLAFGFLALAAFFFN